MPACKRCGNCCTTAFFADRAVPLPGDPQELARWWAYHHCEPMAYPSPDGSLCLGVKVPLVCRHLTNRRGVFSCAIYETRPKVCQSYFCPEVRNGAGL